MRIAIVSDIHGNRTAFEAVLADLREASPDLILHGGDLVHGGSASAETVDHVRDLGWAGVLGNADEMLARPESLEEFASQSPKLEGLFAAIREMAPLRPGLRQPISCSTISNLPSAAWSTMWRGRSGRLRQAAFLTPIGSRKCSKAAGPRCREDGQAEACPTYFTER